MLQLHVVAVDQIHQILAVERIGDAAAVAAATEQAKNRIGEPCGEDGDGIEQQVEEVYDGREKLIIEVGVLLDDGLGHELAAEEYHHGGNHRFEQHRTVGGHALPPRRRRQQAQKQRHAERVDHQTDVVAHQDGGYVLSRVAFEQTGDEIEHGTLLTVDLLAQAVFTQKSDLHAREKCRQHKHYAYQYHGVDKCGGIHIQTL